MADELFQKFIDSKKKLMYCFNREGTFPCMRSQIHHLTTNAYARCLAQIKNTKHERFVYAWLCAFPSSLKITRTCLPAFVVCNCAWPFCHRLCINNVTLFSKVSSIIGYFQFPQLSNRQQSRRDGRCGRDYCFSLVEKSGKYLTI